MATVKDYLSENQDKLDTFTRAITAAHGKNHPEVFEVRKEYLNLKEAVAAGANLDNNFAQMRETTQNYAIPDDVCPTFEATYHMLANADEINAKA
ncbi:iron-sulfur cluster repair di-iron protein, ric [Companilactobacillus mishanensis]|uniref:Iron-sulfur cluster repair di-iron protein, ric n=1 Tax=Companilactobacillus mishanensis TaxID=2486008 RepID=A0A5P0ZJ21_9LACO|nr:iron-sulfur cluster repair di-iron protein, ric [Companilactobacillus mishanensis]MQS44589.1 iron-sulfur cluster repair di-iron protein, ric [Companilactobacillus mishanensis]MQS53116.1 iron-sulfur cluster repair di-iron protein, ric [Companilactobacillus mishanensis]